LSDNFIPNNDSKNKCKICGKSTENVDIDYLIDPTLHLKCSLELENKKCCENDNPNDTCIDCNC